MAGLAGRLDPFLERAPDGRLEPAEVVRRYVQDGSFTGGEFDQYGLERSDPNVVSAHDLIAVTMLSIEITLRTTRGIRPESILAIERHQQQIRDHLAALGDDRDLATMAEEREFEAKVGGTQSPAAQLYWLLRNKDIGLPRVATYKLLARKRPRLLPVRDTVLEAALYRGDDWWRAWWYELTTRPELPERLAKIRDGAATPHLSLLRVADILVWVRQRGADQVSGLREQIGSPVRR